MPDERPVPQLAWFWISADIIKQGTWIDIQEASEYPGLRFHFTYNLHTGERASRFYIRGIEYPSLNEAIDAWKVEHKPKRKRLSNAKKRAS